MTEQEKLALHALKGILEAHMIINRVTVQVANETKADCPSPWMEGYSTGQIRVAWKAIDQGLIALAEVDKILAGGYDG